MFDNLSILSLNILQINPALKIPGLTMTRHLDFPCKLQPFLYANEAHLSQGINGSSPLCVPHIPRRKLIKINDSKNAVHISDKPWEITLLVKMS